MVDYISRFTLSLKNPIETLEDAFSPLEHKYDLNEVTILVIINTIVEDNFISKFQVSVTYIGDNLQYVAAVGNPAKGIMLMAPGGDNVAFFVGRQIIQPLLYHLSGVTLQTRIFWNVFEDLEGHVTDFTWELPNGKKVPQIPMKSPVQAQLIIRETGRQPLSIKDWNNSQDFLNGTGQEPLLWKSILAEAHRERWNDVRSVVLKCATALEIGIQPHLIGGIKFNIQVFRGKKENIKIPDLKSRDFNLYTSLSKIWYSRHGIIHKGSISLYDKNPETSGVKPLRPLNYDDAIEFLDAVPRGIEYFLENQPLSDIDEQR